MLSNAGGCIFGINRSNSMKGLQRNQCQCVSWSNTILVIHHYLHNFALFQFEWLFTCHYGEILGRWRKGQPVEGEGRCQGYKPELIFIVKLHFHGKLLQHRHRCKWRTSELSIRQNLPRPIPVNSPQWHVLLPWRHHMMAIYLIAWKAPPKKGVSSLAC